jgi:hypothetical protein
MNVHVYCYDRHQMMRQGDSLPPKWLQLKCTPFIELWLLAFSSSLLQVLLVSMHDAICERAEEMKLFRMDVPRVMRSLIPTYRCVHYET